MAFDEAWEEIFRGRDWGKYPSEEVVRFIASKFNKSNDRTKIRVLDVGCGGGAHTWFLSREGFDVYGIDGSHAAIAQAKSLLDRDELNAKLMVGDFTELKYPIAFFDAVIDSNSLQHNTWPNIEHIHEQIFELVKPGGFFFGLLINTDTSSYDDAELVEENTYRNFNSGPIQKNLLVHFFTEPEVAKILSRYKDVVVEKIVRSVNNQKDKYGHFIVTAQKPG